MIERENIIKKIRSLPEGTLKEVAEFIEFLETRRKWLNRESEEGKEGDELSKVIGICEGPPDLAERHDEYIYGTK